MTSEIRILLILAAAVSASPRAAAQSTPVQPRSMYIHASKINLREHCDRNLVPVRKLEIGEVVSVTAITPEWVELTTADGQQGCIPSGNDYVLPYPPTAEHYLGIFDRERLQPPSAESIDRAYASAERAYVLLTKGAGERRSLHAEAMVVYAWLRRYRFLLESGKLTGGPPATKTIVTKASDRLWSICSTHYGDPYLWPALYDANRSIIGPDFDFLPVGISLRLPPLRKMIGALESLSRARFADVAWVSAPDINAPNTPKQIQQRLSSPGKRAMQIKLPPGTSLEDLLSRLPTDLTGPDARAVRAFVHGYNWELGLSYGHQATSQNATAVIPNFEAMDLLRVEPDDDDSKIVVRLRRLHTE